MTWKYLIRVATGPKVREIRVDSATELDEELAILKVEEPSAKVEVFNHQGQRFLG